MCNPATPEVANELSSALAKYREATGDVVGEMLSPIHIAGRINAARQHLTEQGYAYTGKGSTRDVYVMPCQEHVVKIQPFGSSNSREIEMSRRDVPCLVPVVEQSICGGWLVMPFAHEHHSGVVPHSDRSYVEEQLADSGWSVEESGDIRYIDSEPYLCDYGAPWERVT